MSRANFGSKIGVILATAGSAVGLGNVWRFPYMAGADGGAAFIIIYIGCVLLLGIPCMISEFIIGRHAKTNAAKAYRKFGGHTIWAFVGYLGVITSFLITSYYAVVSGWCAQYIYGSLLGHLHGTPEYFQQYFHQFEVNPVKPILWTVVLFAITHYVIVHGVRDGIERASKIMMPTLFILLLIIVAASCTLPDAAKGIAFLFKPDFSKIDSGAFLGALGQSFYSLSIAMGILCTYASYFSRQVNLTRTAAKVGVIDTVVAVLAGLMIFPAAFSVGVSPDSGPSLIFITLPNVFQQAFGGIATLGYIVSLLFYILLTLAALTSLISLHEVSTAFFQEELRITRNNAAWIVTVSCCVIGALCSMSLGQWKGLSLFGMPLFQLIDLITGQIMLPVGGFLTCLFVGWYLPHKMVREEYTNWGTMRGRFFHIYLLSVKYICPFCILLIFLHQLNII